MDFITNVSKAKALALAKEIIELHPNSSWFYWVPALFLRAGKVQKALDIYNEHERSDPQDSKWASPMFLCCSLLAHIKLGYDIRFDNEPGALMRRTHIANRYMIPLILGDEQIQQLDVWHMMNTSTLEYAKSLPPWVFELWSEDDRVPVREACKLIEFEAFKSTDESLCRNLDRFKLPKERGPAVKRLFQFREVILGPRQQPISPEDE